MRSPVVTQELDKMSESSAIQTLAAIERQKARASQRCGRAVLGCHVQQASPDASLARSDHFPREGKLGLHPSGRRLAVNEHHTAALLQQLLLCTANLLRWLLRIWRWGEKGRHPHVCQ